MREAPAARQFLGLRAHLLQRGPIPVQLAVRVEGDERVGRLT
jgi:hypothetical protein